MLEELLYTIKLRVEDGSISSMNDKRGSQGAYIIPEYKDLFYYKEVLQKEYENIREGFKPCLKQDQLDCIKDFVLKITGPLCKKSNRELGIDESNKTKWLIDHPYCVAYDEWEKWSYYICGRLNIDFKIEKKKTCDFTLELTRKIIPCNILVYIQAQKKSCDLGIKLDIDKDRCKAELSILRSEVECDLNLHTYIELKKCNVNFDMIKEVYKCNLKLNINSKLEPVLVTDLNEYALDCINPSSLEPLLEINQTPTINIKDILNNYK